MEDSDAKKPARSSAHSRISFTTSGPVTNNSSSISKLEVHLSDTEKQWLAENSSQLEEIDGEISSKTISTESNEVSVLRKKLSMMEEEISRSRLYK